MDEDQLEMLQQATASHPKLFSHFISFRRGKKKLKFRQCLITIDRTTFIFSTKKLAKKATKLLDQLYEHLDQPGKA